MVPYGAIPPNRDGFPFPCHPVFSKHKLTLYHPRFTHLPPPLYREIGEPSLGTISSSAELSRRADTYCLLILQATSYLTSSISLWRSKMRQRQISRRPTDLNLLQRPEVHGPPPRGLCPTRGLAQTLLGQVKSKILDTSQKINNYAKAGT